MSEPLCYLRHYQYLKYAPKNIKSYFGLTIKLFFLLTQQHIFGANTIQTQYPSTPFITHLSVGYYTTFKLPNILYLGIIALHYVYHHSTSHSEKYILCIPIDPPTHHFIKSLPGVELLANWSWCSLVLLPYTISAVMKQVEISCFHI